MSTDREPSLRLVSIPHDFDDPACDPARTLIGHPKGAHSSKETAALVEAGPLVDVVHGEIVIPGSTDPFPTMIGTPAFPARRSGLTRVARPPVLLRIGDREDEWRELEDLG